MWLRALVTALALTYLICVLTLSGVQKEDLDVNTLEKLKQHNVNLDDLNNETQRDCVANTYVQSKINKQGVSDEPTPTWHPVVTESNTLYREKSRVKEVPDVEQMIEYVQTPQLQPESRLVNNKILKEIHSDIEDNTTKKTTSERSDPDTGSLRNPENVMNFWSMYSKFQQSQKQVHNNATVTTLKVVQTTDKNDIFQITINNYIRNDSSLEHNFSDHRNKKAKEQNFTSKEIADRIHELNENTGSKDRSDNLKIYNWLYDYRTNQEHKNYERRGSNLETERNSNEITKAILDKIPPLTLREIVKEVQDVVIKGLTKTTMKPPVTFSSIDHDIARSVDNANMEADRIPSSLLRHVVDNAKKMLLSELWNETVLKQTVTTSTVKSVTADIGGSLTTKSDTTRVDPELDNFIKLYAKFKSWKAASTTPSSSESERSKIEVVNTEFEYPSIGMLSTKHKGKQFTNSIMHTDTLKPHGFPNHITEDEDQLIEPDPHSGKNIEIIPQGSAENFNENYSKIKIPIHRIEKKYHKNKVVQHLEQNLNLKDDLNSDSAENKCFTNSKHAGKNVQDAINSNPNVRSKSYLDADMEYKTNSKSANPHMGDGKTLESTNNLNGRSTVFKDSNPNQQSFTTSEKFSTGSDSNGRVCNPDETEIDSDIVDKDQEIKISKHTPREKNNHRSSDQGSNLVKDVSVPASYIPTVPVKEEKSVRDDEKNVNLLPDYNAYASQNNPKLSVIQDQFQNVMMKPTSDKAVIYSQVIKHIQGNLMNTPNSAYNPNALPNVLAQNQDGVKHEEIGVNTPNANAPAGYANAPPNYSINKPKNIQQQSDILSSNNRNVYNPYNAPNYLTKNNIGGAQNQNMEGISFGNPSAAGYPGSPDYLKNNNNGDQNQVSEITLSLVQEYQGAQNYSAQNNIGSIQKTAVRPNTYPYNYPQYFAKDISEGIRDPRTFSFNMANQNANNYQRDFRIGDTQVGSAISLPNPNVNGGLHSTFNSVISEKQKNPLIQDTIAQSLMNNPSLSVGLSFNRYLPQTYPGMNPNGQELRGVIPYFRGGQNPANPTLTDANLPTLNNVQGGIITSQNNPYQNRLPSPSRNNINIAEQYNEKNQILYNPYSSLGLSSPYGIQKPIEGTEARFAKAKDAKNYPNSIAMKNDFAFNTISKFYPITTKFETPHIPVERSTEKVDLSAPIMLQTNDDEIMPLGIPIHIRGESKFHMSLVQNQHIIVTTTTTPRSRLDDWNDYKLAKDYVGNQGKEKQKYIPLALSPRTPHQQKRVWPPRTHHDFEDLPYQDKQNNYREEQFNNMRPRSEFDFESRLSQQNSRESILEGRHQYNPEMQDVRYHNNRFDDSNKVTLYRNQEKIHESINAGDLTIAPRHQVPLKRPQVSYDDTHFQNFLKTQEKVNEILERILATRPKSLSLEPLKNR